MNRLLKILAVVIAINSFPLGRFGGGLYAQDNSARIYSQAENDYKIGRIEEIAELNRLYNKRFSPNEINE